MKKLISFLILSTVCIIVKGQTVSANDDNKICVGFDPAMWEQSSREPLKNELISMAGELKNKTVLDIGAGSGYFTFGFAAKSRKVIATELDKRFLDYIDQKEKSLNLVNIEIRLADERQSELNNLKNVDVTLMVLVYHFLDDPRSFLTKIKSTMSKGGQIIIVNGSHFSSRFITDYLEATGFKEIRIKKFTLAGGSCGPETYNIVSAKNF